MQGKSTRECIAITKLGVKCKQPPVGKRRWCRFHGGYRKSGAQPGNSNAVSHGQTTAEAKKNAAMTRGLISAFRCGDIGAYDQLLDIGLNGDVKAIVACGAIIEGDLKPRRRRSSRPSKFPEPNYVDYPRILQVARLVGEPGQPSLRAIAKRDGVAFGTLRKAVMIIRWADELISQIEWGQMSISKAHRIADVRYRNADGPSHLERLQEYRWTQYERDEKEAEKSRIWLAGYKAAEEKVRREIFGDV